MLLDQMDAVLLITDEIVDGGIVLETDAMTLAKNATRKVVASASVVNKLLFMVLGCL